MEDAGSEGRMVWPQDLLEYLDEGLTSANIGVDIINTDYTVLYQNQLLCGRYGDLAEDHCYEKYFGRDTPCTFCPMQSALQSGHVEQVHVTGTDGGHYLIVSAPISGQNGVADKVIELVMDVTEPRNYELALQELRDFLDIIVEKTPSPMWVSDGNGTIIRMNQAVRDLLQVTDEEVVEKFNVLDDIQLKEQGYLEKIRSVYLEGKTVEFILEYDTSRVHVLERDPGVVRKIHMMVSPVLDEQGTVMYAICVQKDLTELELLEQSLVRTNRALRVLSACNQVMVHSTDEMTLLHDICSTLVEKGGYLFAWVGYAEQDSGKTIKPVASSGNGDEYLSSFHATWADTREGQGPTSIAIRSGKVDIVENTQTDPRFTVVRDQAISYGFLSAVSLPLINDGHIYGAITIYADTTEAFTEDEIRLLTEMSDDLAYGIFSLRVKKEKEEAEEEIKENEKRLIDALELGNMANWEYDMVNEVMSWHEGMYEIYARDPSMGPPGFEENRTYYSADQLEKITGYADNLVATKKEQSYTIDIIDGGGVNKSLACKNRPILDENGEIIRIFGIVQDITEQVKTVKMLRDSERTYRSLVENSGLGIAIVQDGEKVFVNNKFAEMLGMTREEYLRTQYLDLVHPEDRETVTSVNDQQLAQSKPIGPGEVRFKTKTGEQRWFEVRSDGIIWDGKPAVQAYFSDITEKKLAEDAIRRSEEQLATVIEAIPQGLIVADINGIVTHANAAIITMLGLNGKDGMLGKRSGDFVIDEDRDRILGIVDQAWKTGDQLSFECTMIRTDGTTFLVETNVAIIHDSAGNSAGLVGITQDITERIQMAEQLVVTDRLASLGELAAGIAHELSNPLTSVLGLSDLLMDGDDTSEELRNDLEIINREATRASQVVSHLLTFARRHPDEKTYVQVNDIIKLVMQLREYEQNVHNITTILDLEDDLPSVFGNDFQLQQVFINLIINAEYFMVNDHDKGILTISTRNVGDMVRITFKDDGPGITPEVLTHVFDPFYTTKAVGKGTGLGLSICHGIIVEHKGNLYAESTVGEGATFIVELPVNM